MFLCGPPPSRHPRPQPGRRRARIRLCPLPCGRPSLTSCARDDANLHDVCFLGSRDGWSVGDRGTVWRTEDGGQAWELLPVPTDCVLRSACFLTDRIGWVAGGSTTPFTRVGVGVILSTRDGGKTWTNLARSGRPLPQLHYVRFFSPNAGVVVGEPTSEFPAGVITTADGGRTWQALEGPRHDGWRAADFLAPSIGVVAGLEGEAARIDGGRVLDVRAGRFGLRGLYDVKLGRDDSGWMVGDEALVLRTHNRGVVWETPPMPLPEETRSIFNFHALAVRGERLWIAGSPGSVIWHSPDGGRSWRSADGPDGSARTARLYHGQFRLCRRHLRLHSAHGRRRSNLGTGAGGQTPGRVLGGAVAARSHLVQCAGEGIGRVGLSQRRPPSHPRAGRGRRSSRCDPRPQTARSGDRCRRLAGRDGLALSARRSGARPRSAEARRGLDAAHGRQVSADVLWPSGLPDPHVAADRCHLRAASGR